LCRAFRFCDRAVEQSAVCGGAAFGHVGDHEALGGVGDAGFVAEADRSAGIAAVDRARVRVDQRHAPIGDRPLAGKAQVGLGEDLLCSLQLMLQPLA